MQWNGERKARLRKKVPLKTAINEESPNLERFFYALDSG
jgi:hypothetical protein